MKLNERVRNITEWRDKLDQCLRDLNLEISVQKDAKEACERALEAKVLSEPSKFSTKLLLVIERLCILSECILIRS